MLNSLSPVIIAGSMVPDIPSFEWDSWAQETLLLQSLRSELAALRPHKTMSSSSKGDGSGKKREPRPANRKVSSLSSEQLERKRANDREAQRLIRQRTKDNIEQLESQVAKLQNQVNEMQPRCDQFDEMLRHNAALESEVRDLRQQMATLTQRASFPDRDARISAYVDGWPMEEISQNTTSGISLVPSAQFSGSSHQTSNMPRAAPPAPALASNRSFHPNAWPTFNTNTRSRSLGDCSNPDPSSYVIDGQPHQGSRLVPPSLSVAVPRSNHGSQTSSPNLQRPEPLYPQSAFQRSMPMSILSPNQASSVQSYQAAPSDQTSLNQNPQGNQTYQYGTWAPES
ncbi:hypothetical protein N7466_001149 [Penicillium verhagenii]|uniref:uncharacterized protein n=1 Tax=Penicillium verhagenii TaxID=1562060 RepID=UPI002544DC0A|nr:uncharacterized protein N7466_001149 [Penicillium verhagenii]KAJ5948134.1 hypothetical protein N7466_001149 [Penicillium verhagenii]